jgi:hypothetical protein
MKKLSRCLLYSGRGYAALCSVYDDVELLDWPRWAEGDGPSFLRTIAEAAFTADLNDYNLLRPCLNSRGNDRNQPEGLYVRALSTVAEIVLFAL